MINRNTILTGIASILMGALVLPWICFIAQAQTDTTFKPTDKFDIPENNSTINFATSGIYFQASLENGTWNFVDLLLNNSQRPEKLTLKVSAQDSNVTIRSYEIYNTSSTGGIRLRYIVTGQGNQTFDFGFNPKGGEWDVTFNGLYIEENDGWRVSPDATLTITGATANFTYQSPFFSEKRILTTLTKTGATANVTIRYISFPDFFGGNGNSSNQPIYQQHLVAIITAVAVAITVTLTIAIRRKNKELLS